MRQLILILILIFLSVPIFSQFNTNFIEQCFEKSGEDATYLKDFQVVLAAAQSDHMPPVARYPLVLSNSYDKNTGKEYNPFNFMCQKTGIYHVFISFSNGKEGKAVGILSYVTK